MEMKTLTVNGKTYIVADPDAAHFDNSKPGDGAWSGKNTVDQLCPTFTESGSVVSCHPVEGYPLDVVSRIEPVQEGEGAPRPAGWSPVADAAVQASDSASVRIPENLLTHGQTYRLLVNAANAAGDRVRLSPACSMVAYNEGGGVETDIVVGEHYIEFDYSSYGVEFSLVFEDTVDENSMFDISEASGDTQLKDGAFVLQEYDPGNVRPITGFDAVQLTHGNIEGSSALTAVFGQTVGKGTYDWSTGELKITHALIRLTSDMKWVMTGASNPNGIRSFYVNENTENAADSSTKPVMSSHYIYVYNWSVSSVAYENAIKILNSRIYLTDARFTDLASFKAFLEEETVQLMYPLAEPVTVQLAPTEILALSGTNTIYSDTGDTQVSGKADLRVTIEKLTNAIIALGGKV